MKLGIMQPYFFPYLGYFDVIFRTDRWVVFDTAQYIRHGWVNRNRILHPQQGDLFIIAPLQKHHRETPIKDIYVAENSAWREKIIGQLNHYRKKAPYFNETLALVQNCLGNPELSLSRLNTSILEKVCAHLGIPFHYQVFSEMNLPVLSVDDPGDWALRISQAMKAEEYINPPGGKDLFDERKYIEGGVKLTVRDFQNMTYETKGYSFMPALSIIDVLMWNTPEQIVSYLRSLP